ncbi:TRAP transporter large permease [Nitratireductor indicus]|uniref:TRAP transporter large permease protein n=1 Tax=Nitratireductor indicus C115 TaxID=1231190 RepID=K2P386_9HYPH|nr:TRAP transporter large permease [Nitratireductor indicus]EKF44514.1 TRAP dicarboxylate transporter subunit DctM [Nitratireductor indicus C115]MDS1137466.1 TRAP transporter large permease [Nitratireductor indicus]SFQ30798.1 TRAP transporter, DctM subunit [Nitratireductor indicus]
MLYQSYDAGIAIGSDVLLSLALLAVLFLLAVPVWIALGISALVMLWSTGVLPLSLLGESLFGGVNHYALIAIPLYLLTGDALVRSGLSKQLLDVAEATMGSLRSGMGTSTVLGCGFFSCISGSDAAGCAAVGRMTYSRLVEKGYPPNYASALVAAGACTGILIPPSIAYIIIGMILGVSAASLFVAAIVPGVLVLTAIMVTNVVVNRVCGYEKSGQSFSFRRWLEAVWEAKYALSIPLIILGGIYSGIFTPTEAAAVAVMVTLLIGFYKKTLTFADIPDMLWSSAKVNGIIVPIIAVALPLAQALTLVHVPQSFVGMITSLTDDPVYIVLLMLAVLLVAGCFMEATPNIVILAPIMYPLGQEVGMHEIQFCIFMITALGVGFITPPLGLNLFVISSITGGSIFSIAARSIPFVIVMIGVVLAIAFFPSLSTWAFQ